MEDFFGVVDRPFIREANRILTLSRLELRTPSELPLPVPDRRRLPERAGLARAAALSDAVALCPRRYGADAGEGKHEHEFESRVLVSARRVVSPRRRQPPSAAEPIFKEMNMEGTITTEDLKLMLDRKDHVKLVETLAPERYSEAHLPGALNIPPEKIKELAPQLLPNKDAQIVTYCTSMH
jgi:hypothetical protein